MHTAANKYRISYFSTSMVESKESVQRCHHIMLIMLLFSSFSFCSFFSSLIRCSYRRRQYVPYSCWWFSLFTKSIVFKRCWSIPVWIRWSESSGTHQQSRIRSWYTGTCSIKAECGLLYCCFAFLASCTSIMLLQIAPLAHQLRCLLFCTNCFCFWLLCCRQQRPRPSAARCVSCIFRANKKGQTDEMVLWIGRTCWSHGSRWYDLDTALLM